MPPSPHQSGMNPYAKQRLQEKMNQNPDYTEGKRVIYIGKEVQIIFGVVVGAAVAYGLYEYTKSKRGK